MRFIVTVGLMVLVLFFFQAEDGIRDDLVTGVQTCALPISGVRAGPWAWGGDRLRRAQSWHLRATAGGGGSPVRRPGPAQVRTEGRRRRGYARDRKSGV